MIGTYLRLKESQQAVSFGRKVVLAELETLRGVIRGLRSDAERGSAAGDKTPRPFNRGLPALGSQPQPMSYCPDDGVFGVRDPNSFRSISTSSITGPIPSTSGFQPSPSTSGPRPATGGLLDLRSIVHDGKVLDLATDEPPGQETVAGTPEEDVHRDEGNL